MFSRTIFFSVLGLYLSAFTAQAAPSFRQSQDDTSATCTIAVVTKVATVTITAQPSATAGNGNNGNDGGNNDNSGNNDDDDNNNGGGGGGNDNSGGSNNNSNGGGNSGNNNNGDTTNNGGNNGGNNGKNNNGGGGNGGNIDNGNGQGGNNGGSNGNTGSNNGSDNVAPGDNGGDDGGNNNDNGGAGGDPQTSLTLDPRVIAAKFAEDGQAQPTAGQVPSLTSTNNFINFCLTVDAPITDGQQITGGSCNPAPIGAIPSTDHMPSAKFTFPPNFGNVAANAPFTIAMVVKNIELGNFVNAQKSYFAAPQQINGNGEIIGHSHVVIEQIDSLDSRTVTNPKDFVFFKGMNEKPNGNGELTAEVTAGLPPGVYRLASINSSSNHQPVIVPVAQHGSLDDMVYFTVTENGAGIDDGAASAEPPFSATASEASASASATISASATEASVTASENADSASVTTSASGAEESVTASTSESAPIESASASSVADSDTESATATASASSEAEFSIATAPAEPSVTDTPTKSASDAEFSIATAPAESSSDASSTESASEAEFAIATASAPDAEATIATAPAEPSATESPATSEESSAEAKGQEKEDKGSRGGRFRKRSSRTRSKFAY